MRFLLVVKQNKNVDAFLGTMTCLVERGHAVTLAVQDRDDKRDARLASALDSAGVNVIRAPSVRTDQWNDVASLVRRLRDSVHYLQPAMRSAAKLRTRVLERVRQDLQFNAETAALAHGLQSIPEDQVQRLETVFALAEQSLPSDPLFDRFLADHQPDVLLVSPLIHFGPAQADLVASARRLRIPVWMLLYSWDNLSTKGCIHRFPDRIFVWNEQQRREAEALHGFPPERVVVVGAPRFDSFFALRPLMTRAEFHEPLDLDPAKPTLLYVCSSRFVSEKELPFIRRWLGELRGSTSANLRECNVVFRPHPDIPLLPEEMRMTRHRWPAAPDLVAKTARPFDDARAVVLQTGRASAFALRASDGPAIAEGDGGSSAPTFDAPQGLYESITHSAAVVGLNTTAELEAGIVGRPVFTILADDADVDGQRSTLHFHYLTKELGGFVSNAATFVDHVAHIDEALRVPVDPAPIRAFIESFLRPHGIDKPVAPLFAEALEKAGATTGRASVTGRASSAPTNTTPAMDNVGADLGRPDLDLPIASRADRDRPVLPLAVDGTPALHVYVTPAAERMTTAGAVPVDRDTIDWLEREVALGDVVYDIGAGIGEYVLVAAKRRGAVVVAFEPGFAAYGYLCDNVLLNECEASVVPIPLALAARDGLAEIKYQQGQPGEPGYMVRDDIDWRVKHRGRNRPYLQPACLARLDTVVERFRVPVPNHLRLAPSMSAEAVLAGATATLALPSLKTVCLSVAHEIDDTLVKRFVAQGWEVRRVRPDSRPEPALHANDGRYVGRGPVTDQAGPAVILVRTACRTP